MERVAHEFPGAADITQRICRVGVVGEDHAIASMLLRIQIDLQGLVSSQVYLYFTTHKEKKSIQNRR